MDNSYINLEYLSAASGFITMVLDANGRTRFVSSDYGPLSDFMDRLHSVLDCGESCRISFIYGCYQARRFGGRYIFFAPSGLVYCASPLSDEGASADLGVLAGPFILTDHDDFIEMDVFRRKKIPEDEASELTRGVKHVPCRTPRQIHAISEHLYLVSSALRSQNKLSESAPARADIFLTPYPIEKENELLTAISKGDVHTSEAILNEMLKQIMVHCGGNIEMLRSRAVELTALLSRAAMKGGADINSILGLNYGYIKEINDFLSLEDILLWLQTAVRRFTRHVFDFAGAKHMDIIYKAVDYIKRNYSAKISLKDIADHLYISLSYFCRIFKEETGQTPGGYITSVRIEESKKLLRSSTVNISEIPDLVGFESQSYFTKIFKKNEGCTPGYYRRRNSHL